MATVLLVITLLVAAVSADFMFPTFDKTTGLVFNGDATTSSCDPNEKFLRRHGVQPQWPGYPEKDYDTRHGDSHYQKRHGISDYSRDPVDQVRGEDASTVFEQDVETDTPATSKDVARDTAILGHRDKYKHAPTPEGGCPVRLRLTPSESKSRGSVWYATPIAVLKGFVTEFKFQMTDPSRSCTIVRDKYFNTKHHKSCMVHGGDGFAFVIHGHPNRTSTLGAGHSGLGYGGVANSLAVEFDTWYNPENGDLFMDHVSVQSRGQRPNSPGSSARLGTPTNTSLADGEVHTARVAYYPFVNFAMAHKFTSSSQLLPYIYDNDEQNRVGTLAVWVDDMRDTEPLFAMPINLSLTLQLMEGTAYAGFTSATGRAWQKHDITAWFACEDYRRCAFSLDPASPAAALDYHEKSKLNAPPPVGTYAAPPASN